MLVLASQSPRRAELLRQLQVEFSQQAVDIDESLLADEQPLAHVQRLAQTKAMTGWQRTGGQHPVLGSDTIVVSGTEVLGKPTDKADFARMMTQLSATTHQVMTAVSVVSGEHQQTCVVSTDVTFKPLTDNEIDWYWHTGEPQDKAGGYGIQGLAGQFVTRINGSYSAVVGLPLFETAQLLTSMGIR